MALRTLTTVVLDCDACDEVLADVVPCTEKQTLQAAQRLGWTYTEDEKDLCPACTAKRQAQPAAIAGSAA